MKHLRKLSFVFSLLSLNVWAQYKVALIGDSTVAAYKTSSLIRGWGEFLPWLFKANTVVVKNFAVPGKSSKTFITEGSLSKVISERPHFVLIDLGINDVNPSTPSHSTKAEYAINLRYMIQRLKAVGSQVILVHPHTLNVLKDGTFGADGGIQGYRQVMSQVGQIEKVPLLPFYDSTKTHFNKLGPSKTRQYFTDAVHFNIRGAQMGAQRISILLKASKSPLGRLVK